MCTHNYNNIILCIKRREIRIKYKMRAQYSTMIVATQPFEKEEKSAHTHSKCAQCYEAIKVHSIFKLNRIYSNTLTHSEGESDRKRHIIELWLVGNSYYYYVYFAQCVFWSVVEFEHAVCTLFSPISCNKSHWKYAPTNANIFKLNGKKSLPRTKTASDKMRSNGMQLQCE